MKHGFGVYVELGRVSEPGVSSSYIEIQTCSALDTTISRKNYCTIINAYAALSCTALCYLYCCICVASYGNLVCCIQLYCIKITTLLCFSCVVVSPVPCCIVSSNCIVHTMLLWSLNDLSQIVMQNIQWSGITVTKKLQTFVLKMHTTGSR